MQDSTPTSPIPFVSLDTMSPISHRQTTGHHYKELTYQITVTPEGESYITAVTDGDALSAFHPADQRVVREMRRISRRDAPFGFETGSDTRVSVSLGANSYLLDMMPRTAKLQVEGHGEARFDDSYARLSLRLDEEKKGKDLRPRLELSVGEDSYDSPLLLTENAVAAGGRVLTVPPVGSNFGSIRSVLEPIKREQLEIYLSLFVSYFDNIVPVLGDREARYSPNPEQAVPTIVLEKVAPDQALYLRLTSTVDTLSEEALENLTLTRTASVDEAGQIVVRDIAQPDLDASEKALAKIILDSAPGRQARKEVFQDNRFFIIPAETASPFLLNHLADVLREFRLIGSERLKEYQISAAQPKLNLRLSSGIDFLEGSAEVEIGEEKFSIADLLNQYSRNRYVKLSDGNRAIIDSKYISRLERLFRSKKKGNKIKVSFFDLPEVEELIQGKIKGDFAAGVRKVYEGFNGLKDAALPPLEVKAQLRDYQKQGVKWLKYLYDNNLGGCLADDMGLGKTLQTIALLTLVGKGEGSHRSLIVMPRSLLFNWEKEFEKFAPEISVRTYYGPDRNLEKALEGDVMITTYAVARNDIEQLKEVEFEFVILDESQNIKNVGSQTSQAVTLLNAKHRLALSGTPMENNLTELYSLFRFLNPTMFGTLEDFNSRYTYPIQKGGDKDASDALRRKIYPFILRRLKRDVLTELPPRIDRTLYVEMSEQQRKYYEERRVAFKLEIEQSIRTSGVAKSQFVMFQALNELRRIASVPESMTDGRIASPKISELVESLTDTVGNGHKCVVFFNYIAGLDIVAERLGALGIEYETMTGSTSTTARKRIVERFQTDPDCKVLLMTLKVGGVGLNLTAADMVFIFEPWWNKAAENQAIDRLHRIGQKASVVSTSFITEGTIEEKIRQLQEQKKELFDTLISDDTAGGKQLSEEEINFILS